MDPISRLNRLMETLRQQTTASVKRPGAKIRSKETPPRERAQPSRVEELRERVKERVSGLAADDPERQERARRIFLETVVAWEFGDQMLLDPEFAKLVDQLHTTFDTDPDVQKELDGVLRELNAKRQ